MAEHTESPQIQIEMHEFEISRYPVSNAQFEAFTRDGGYTEKWRNCWTIAGWAWKSDRSAPGVLSGDHAIGNHPIVMVSWYEAVAFCKWLGQKLGARVALPKETQWEKAARGIDARVYPSGIQLTPEQANYQACELGVTTAVGMFPKGESPYGVLDMSGNVAEWCLTKWQETHDLIPQDDIEGTSYRVIKGGSYTHDQRA